MTFCAVIYAQTHYRILCHIPYSSFRCLAYWIPYGKIRGKSSESVQFGMLKACDACADMGQL